MSRLVKRLRREPTTPGVKNASQTFTSPGVYQPKFGKVKIYVSGRGESGNSPTPGTIANYNAPTPGNYVSTNPSTGGNYVGTNPNTGGTYAGTNPTTGGNVSGYNPVTPSTYAGTNPPVLGNVSGYNPATPGYTVTTPGNYVPGNPYINPYTTSPTPGNTVTNPGTYTPGNYVPYSQQIIEISPSAHCPTGWVESWGYQSDGAEIFHNCTLTVQAYSNPSVYTPGTSYSNSPTPGVYYPGNYNPGTYTPGNVVPGNINSPTYTPGTYVAAYSNPASYTPGNYVPASYTPGITNPGTYTPGNFSYVPTFSRYEALSTVGGIDDYELYNTGYDDANNINLQPSSKYSNAFFPTESGGTIRGGYYVVNYQHYTVTGPANPGTYNPGNSNTPVLVPAYTNPGTYSAGNYVPAVSNQPTYTAGYTNPAYSNPAVYTPGNATGDYSNLPTVYYQSGIPGNANYNSTIPGNPYYNPAIPGNAIYNPVAPGTAYYNPIVPGNAVYNPVVPGNANYNPVTPGVANYNPTIPGNQGSAYTTLGVTFPGGAVGAVAPQVGDTLVTLTYSNTGIPVEVRYGGVVIVKEQ